MTTMFLLCTVVEDDELDDPDHFRQVATEVSRPHPAACRGLHAEHGAEADDGRALPLGGSVVTDQEHPQVAQLILDRRRLNAVVSYLTVIGPTIMAAVVTIVATALGLLLARGLQVGVPCPLLSYGEANDGLGCSNFILDVKVATDSLCDPVQIAQKAHGEGELFLQARRSFVRREDPHLSGRFTMRSLKL